MRKVDPEQVVGIFTSDWHLTERAPVARSAEPDWLEAQARPFKQLDLLRKKHPCPLFIVGDLFHRWDASAHLVSWLMWNLSKGAVYGIPGQHDMPQHVYKNLKRSAYWTAVEAGRIHHLYPTKTFDLGAWLMVTAFPWGFPVTPPTQSHGLLLNVALVHAYVWTATTGHAQADPKHKLGAWLPKVKQYDCVFSGDNHTGFLYQDSKLKCSATNRGVRNATWANCGGFQRRTTAERAYRPRVYLLHANGDVKPHFLDTSQEKWADADASVEKLEQATGLDLAGFVEQLNELRAAGHDFPDIVKRRLTTLKLSPEVETIILKAINLKPAGVK